MTRSAGLQMVALVLWLALMVWPAPGEATLGCSIFPATNAPVATCETNSDCATVGGTDCTGGSPGFCFCPSGPNSPLCPCEVAAPAATHPNLIALMVLLSAAGLYQVRRRARGRRHDPA